MSSFINNQRKKWLKLCKRVNQLEQKRLTNLYSKDFDKEIEKIERQSLLLEEKLFGPDSFEAANTLNSLGCHSVYPEERIEFYKRSLKAYERAIKKYLFPELLFFMALDNLGQTYIRQNRYDEFLHFLKDKLPEIEILFGPGGYYFQMYLCKIGDVYLHKKQYKKAGQYYSQARKISIEIERRPNKNWLYELAILYELQGSKTKSKSILKQLKSKGEAQAAQTFSAKLGIAKERQKEFF